MRGGFLLEDGRVAEDAVADAAELVVYGLADGLAVVVSGQRFSEFAPFETEFADFIGQIAAFGERLFDNAELVDRLWPRGMTKERAALDLWMKDVAPSPQLRKWFGHDPARFAEFRAQYIAELDANAAAEELLRICAEYPDVTLLYAAKDPQVNHALVLRDYLEDATAAK